MASRTLFALALAPLIALGCARGSTDNASRTDAGANFDVDLPETKADPAACLAAADSHSSVGCEYYAVHMDGLFSADNGCFVAFVANTFDKPAHVDVSFFGEPVDIAEHVKIPRGSGQSLTYEDYNAGTGLAPGDVAILFLAGIPDAGPPLDTHDNKPVRCPVMPARSTLTQIHGTGKSHAFRIRTDVPVVAYQMLPYGGGAAAVTGATLLLPTSSWDTNYVAAMSSKDLKQDSMDIVAWQDDTNVTILPKVAIKTGGGIDGVDAGVPLTVHLNQGEVFQITQDIEITGSPIQSDKPIGMYAGHPCLSSPNGIPYCDHAEQQIPPIRALGSEYVAAIYRPRTTVTENPPWRIVGAVDGTMLRYDPPVPGAPKTVNLGDVVTFTNKETAFVVKSQDGEHPFLFNGYMTGSSSVGYAGGDGYGDADFVRTVPVPQYLDHYVFFTDPTYPETNLVVTRKRGKAGFSDVTLDCAGTLGGWLPIDSAGVYEMTRIDLVRHDFRPQNGCDNGRHEMKSGAPFGLTVWGWGTTETKSFTRDVSYGYPAGENLAPLNTVVVPARPK